MSGMNCKLERLVRLQAAHDRAREEWCRGVEEELPRGTIIDATLGNARIRGEVMGYGSSWCCHDAGCVYVRNTRTGKTRSVHPTLDTEEVRVVMKPNASGQIPPASEGVDWTVPTIHPGHRDASPDNRRSGIAL